MKRQKLEQLTNEMIEILIIDLQEENATEESQTIKFKHYNKNLVAKVAAAARPKYTLEWSADIIRDEVYATVYESMQAIAANMELEEISLNNPEFAGSVYNMAMLKLKGYLIPESKKSKGEVIKMQEVAASQLGDNEEGQALTIEDILAGQDVNVLMGAKQEKMNHFLNWFNNNKSKILTKKQIEFIKDQSNYTDKDKSYKMRKRIAERVSRAYQEQYGAVSPRIANLMDQENILEEILEAKSFRAAYDKYKDEDFIIDAITEYINLEYLQAFNKGTNDLNTIRAMRIALYKKLGEVITMIEANK